MSKFGAKIILLLNVLSNLTFRGNTTLTAIIICSLAYGIKAKLKKTSQNKVDDKKKCYDLKNENKLQTISLREF